MNANHHASHEGEKPMPAETAKELFAYFL